MKFTAFVFAALAAALFAAQAGVRAQSPAPTPSASAAADPAITARAKEWLHRLETADIDRTQLNAQMDAFLTPDTAKQLAAKIGTLGDPTSFVFVSKQTASGFAIYTYRATFNAATLNEIFVLDSAGKIGGLRLAPPT